jgi:hypothetical protein
MKIAADMQLCGEEVAATNAVRARQRYQCIKCKQWVVPCLGPIVTKYFRHHPNADVCDQEPAKGSSQTDGEASDPRMRLVYNAQIDRYRLKPAKLYLCTSTELEVGFGTALELDRIVRTGVLLFEGEDLAGMQVEDASYVHTETDYFLALQDTEYVLPFASPNLRHFGGTRVPELPEAMRAESLAMALTSYGQESVSRLFRIRIPNVLPNVLRDYLRDLRLTVAGYPRIACRHGDPPLTVRAHTCALVFPWTTPTQDSHYWSATISSRRAIEWSVRVSHNPATHVTLVDLRGRYDDVVADAMLGTDLYIRAESDQSVSGCWESAVKKKDGLRERRFRLLCEGSEQGARLKVDGTVCCAEPSAGPADASASPDAR